MNTPTMRPLLALLLLLVSACPLALRPANELTFACSDNRDCSSGFFCDPAEKQCTPNRPDAALVNDRHLIDSSEFFDISAADSAARDVSQCDFSTTDTLVADAHAVDAHHSDTSRPDNNLDDTNRPDNNLDDTYRPDINLDDNSRPDTNTDVAAAFDAVQSDAQVCPLLYPDLCDAHCVNLLSSPTNCGGCGQSCIDSVCLLGRCTDACVGTSDEQFFTQNMRGCSGSIDFASRESLCAPGWSACTTEQWVIRRGQTVPEQNYWTDSITGYTGYNGSCAARYQATYYCAAATPMRVCVGHDDQAGNTCNWTGCGYLDIARNDFLGGCLNDTTAGTLCCW